MTRSRKLSEPITLDAGRIFKTLPDAADSRSRCPIAERPIPFGNTRSN
jgi:hypothetical protein